MAAVVSTFQPNYNYNRELQNYRRTELDNKVMGQIRTFIAVDISNNIRNSAFKTTTRLQSLATDYNWVEKDHLHITLNFLGDVEEAEVPSVCRLVQNTVAEFGTFELSVNGLGCFPNNDKPRVVWLGIDEGEQELLALNGRLADALEGLRFPRENKDYLPHLTLGRLRRGGRLSPPISEFVGQQSQLRAGKMIVDHVVVYSSFLDRSGPTYTPMSKVDLI